MRFAIIVSILCLICSAAFAEEIKLERFERKTGPLAYVKSDNLKWEKIQKPDDVKAPDGKLVWARLILGKRIYLTCIKSETTGAFRMKGNTLVKEEIFKHLYIDRDRDKDLAEETPVEGKGNQNARQFIVEGLTGEFQIKDSLLVEVVRLCIMSYTISSGQVGVCFRYTGKVKIDDEEFSITWIPGSEPTLNHRTYGMRTTAFFFGKKKLSVPSVSIVMKEEGLYASIETIEESENLVELAVNETLHNITVNKQDLSNLICIPRKGKVYLPKNVNYRYIWAEFRKNTEKGEFRLRVQIGSRNAEIDDSIKLMPVEPLKLTTKVTKRNDKVSLRAYLTGALGQRVTLYPVGRKIAPPVLKIKDTEGTVVAEHTFKPG